MAKFVVKADITVMGTHIESNRDVLIALQEMLEAYEDMKGSDNDTFISILPLTMEESI